MPNRLVPIAAAAAIVLATVGAAAAPASASTGCHDVDVRVAADHSIHLRTHLAAGVVRFDVHGVAGENIQLARPRHGATAADLVADGNLLNTKGDASGIERDFVAAGGVSTGHDLWVRLQAGTYFAIDTAAPSASLGGVVTLHVSGDASSGRLPRAGATITAIHEMDWAKRPARIPTSGILRFVNRSSDYHFVELARLKDPRTTLAQLKAALARNDESIADPSWVYDTGVLAPHLAQASSYHLEKGLYAVLCWWPDEHGVPHALMGMVRLIHVG